MKAVIKKNIGKGTAADPDEIIVDLKPDAADLVAVDDLPWNFPMRFREYVDRETQATIRPIAQWDSFKVLAKDHYKALRDNAAVMDLEV